MEGTATPLLSSATLLLMKFSSENHSGDVNNHSGRIGFFIHFSPESLFTSRRNHYSHHSGTIIHMPRNPQLGRLARLTRKLPICVNSKEAWAGISISAAHRNGSP
jgi:hypothetical protein